MFTETWTARSVCPLCGDYFWTTVSVGDQSVACKCGVSFIKNSVVMAGDPVTDEAIFKTAVAANYQIDENDLTVVEA